METPEVIAANQRIRGHPELGGKPEASRHVGGYEAKNARTWRRHSGGRARLSHGAGTSRGCFRRYYSIGALSQRCRRGLVRSW